MRFEPLPIHGAFLVVAEPHHDERGAFGRLWCREEFARAGLDAGPAQVNVGVNPRRGTLRGLHYQAAPDLEAKLVRCPRGAVWDVIVDLRDDAPTWRRWHAEELAANVPRALFIPAGCAHGYLTLEDDTEVEYFASVPYAAGSARGIRWDDPAIGIKWPFAPALISERDRSWPLLEPRP